MDDIFGIQILTEKLTNLNNSQQSIETLSRWCILHRKKAKQVVETWEKMFNSFPKEKRVPLMYLANDILQNSRRKGSDFVNEFWKVLPRSLKSFHDSGDEYEKNIVMRLVNIWEERKVFGSRVRTLKDEMLGKDSKEPLLSKENISKGLPSIKVVKRDANSVRIKLAVGCTPERIVSAFQLVHDEQPNEDDVLKKYKAAVDILGKLEKDIDAAQGNQYPSPLMSEFLEHESILKQCIDQLENMKETRASLISHLKEALTEQECKLGDIRLHLQVAKTEADHMSSVRQKLTSAPAVSIPASTAIPVATKAVGDANTANHVGSAVLQPPTQFTDFRNPPMQPISFLNSSGVSVANHNPTNHVGNLMMSPVQPTTFANSTSSAEDQNKKTAAAVAAKLAAMTSSAQVLTSVLSSLVAEEAASMNGNMKLGGFSTGSPPLPAEKRPKLERPMQVPDSQTVLTLQLPQQPSSMPSLSSAPPINPPPPPYPPLPPSMQSPITQAPTYNTHGISAAVPFSFGGASLSLPPPPSHLMLSMVRSAPPLQQPPPPPLQPPQSLHQNHHQQQQQQIPTQPPQPLPPPPQQHSIPGFFQPPGIGFFSQTPSASTGPPQVHQR